MTKVVSIRFKPCGKHYFFSPPLGQKVEAGQKVVVETSKGIEIAECAKPEHEVEDALVVPPLMPVIRIATSDDMKTVENNRLKEKEAFDICQEKILEHQLDMKLVSVECNFEGSKITFFFTSDGRVDFRELVKDLAAIFHTRIELRQIGVRDEAKMIGGIGICGRPYCCSLFLDDFASVSTKMAKTQNLSLNPTKISGSCGRLMCCLRFEEDAYEELVTTVPKQGAYVETPDGFGIADSINILRQKVKVRLDNDTENALREYDASLVAAVPGGKPKDGDSPVHVLGTVKSRKASDNEDKDIDSVPSNDDKDEIAVSDSSSDVAADETQSPSETKKKHYQKKRHYYHKKHNSEKKQ